MSKHIQEILIRVKINRALIMNLGQYKLVVPERQYLKRFLIV